MTLCCQGVYRLGNCPCAVDTLTAQGHYTGIQTVSKSAESATSSLRLNSDNLQCGFLCHPQNTKAGDFLAGLIRTMAHLLVAAAKTHETQLPRHRFGSAMLTLKRCTMYFVVTLSCVQSHSLCRFAWLWYTSVLTVTLAAERCVHECAILCSRDSSRLLSCLHLIFTTG